MKKWLRVLSVLLIGLILFGCNEDKNAIKIKEINVVSDNLQFDKDFKLSDIKLDVLKNDGTKEQISLTENMLNTEDLSKFQQEGTHTINVSYMNQATTFQITIEGEKGDPGEDGREVLLQVSDGYIQWKYSGDNEWTNLVELSAFDGADGKDVTFQISDGYIQWQYVGDTSWTNLIELTSLSGEDGVGISSIEMNDVGQFVITYTDNNVVKINIPVIVYTVNFKDYNGYIIDTQVLPYGSSAVAPSNPTREGYTFVGWSRLYTNIIEDKDIYAKYEINTYAVTFESNGGTNFDVMTNVKYSDNIVLPTPEKEGYIFIGWYQSNTNHARPFYEDSEVKANLTLYARWEIEAVTIIEIDGVRYEIYNGEATIVSYSGTETELIIPETIEGYPVTTIGEQAFASTIITSVHIPSSVTSIEYQAFSYTFALQTVTFEESSQLTRIGERAFRRAVALTSIHIPSSVTSIGEGAFSNTSSLAIITFEEDSQLTTIGDYTFYEASSLTGIVIPSSVTSIGEYAFKDAVSLNSTLIPLSVTSIGAGAFSGANSLTIYVEAESQPTGWHIDWNISNRPVVWGIDGYGTYNDYNYVINNGEAIITSYIGKETQLIAPDSINGNLVTTIGENAFKNNATVETIELGQYVTTIEDNAFNNMGSLTNIKLPNSATTIGQNVFTYSSSLSEITLSSELDYELKYLFSNDVIYIPETLSKIKYADGATFIDLTLLTNNTKSLVLELADDWTEIESYQFEYLDYVTEVIIPEGVTFIGEYAFNFSSIQTVHIPSSIMTISEGAFDSAESLTTVTFGENSQLTTIGDWAFYDTPLTSIIIPSSVTSLGDGAFDSAISLTSVTFEENSQLTTIGDWAFWDTSITSFIIPSSVTSIGNGAFEYSSLTTIHIPSSVMSIGHMAFAYTDLLTTITFEENSQLTSIGVCVFSEAVSLTSIEIPSSVTSIGNCAFKNTTSLTSIIIPSSVITIGQDAFTGSSLTSINIPSSVTNIGARAFAYTDFLTSITFEANSQLTSIEHSLFYYSALTSIIIPASITSISDFAFASANSLESVTFEANSQLTSIGGQAFRDTSLTSIHIPSSVTVIGDFAFTDTSLLETVTFGENSLLTTIGRGAFQESSITSINIPSSVTSIEDFTFRGSSTLTTITFEADTQLTSIGNYAFMGTVSLTSINIPSSVTSIGSYAFEGSGLTSINIPANVTYLGQRAFSDTSSLTTVTFEANSQLMRIDNYAFSNTTSLKTVTFGENSQLTSIRYRAFSNASSLTSINLPSGVQAIHDYAFENNSSLIDVYIPLGVTYVGPQAFGGATLLTIYAEAPSQPTGWYLDWNISNRPVVWGVNGHGTYNEFDYVIKNNNEIIILGQTEDSIATDLVIPDTINAFVVTSIQSNAFYNNDQITSIYIPLIIQNVGSYAFKGAVNLVINAAATSQPAGWDSNWNPDNLTVNWGYII